MGISAVKKEFRKQSKEQLINHIGELYKKFSNVKEYLDFYISLDEEQVAKSYKKKIESVFYNSRIPDLRKARQIIAALKKLSVSEKTTIEIHLHYVECAIKSAATYGYFTNSLYNSVYRVYNEAYPLFLGTEYEKYFEKKIYHIYALGDKYGFDF